MIRIALLTVAIVLGLAAQKAGANAVACFETWGELR